ncbi:MAG: endonuclease III [Oscillospiraceae bacterium]|nr:endonuclease III [Oscillospiraceae bacterium]
MKTKKEAAQIVAALENEYPLAECFLDSENAWQLLVAVRLSAQCTDLRVNATTPALFAKFPSISALADADPKDIEEIVRPCGLGKSKARDINLCMKMLRDEYNCVVPDNMDDLLRLPGVGRKSANLILGDVFGKPAIVADTHCIRLSNRIGFISNTDMYKVEMELKRVVAPEKQNDFCHRLVEHGRAVCIARKAMCDKCVLADYCAYKKAEDKKAAKAAQKAEKAKDKN